MANKMAKLKDQSLELKNQLARALADYDNLVKRVDRERTTFEKVSNLRLIMRLLPVLDILKQAQVHIADSGIAITIKEFEDAIKAEGIEEIKAEIGYDFNPNIHEAIDVAPNEGKIGSNKIVEKVSSGWIFIGGPVIRVAKVKVTK